MQKSTSALPGALKFLGFWVVGASVLAAALAFPQANSQSPPLVLCNGDMSQGSDVPSCWDHKWVGKGKITTFRDTKIFKEGPAALGVASVDGAAMGQTAQMIQAGADTTFAISGFVKSQGEVKVNVGVQSYAADGHSINFQQIRYVQNDQDWTAFTKEVTLPKGTKRFGIVLLMDGNGKAWLDEVQLAGKGVKTASSAPSSAPAESPPPKKQDPTVPMYGYYPKYPQAWMNFHKMFVERAKKGNVNIVFFGDSITQGFKRQKTLWKERYAERGAVNFGLGGDRTQQILWRIEHGELDGIQPKLVVLNIGVNNVWGSTPGTRIAEGIEKVVATIRTKLPKTKVLLLGIFPTQQRPDNPLRAKVKAINTQIAKLDNGKTVRYLDIGSKFLEPDGSIAKTTMSDYLHPTAKGYQIWADAMQPLFEEMLR
jgi:lysophospholipase L1-like esterase